KQEGMIDHDHEPLFICELYQFLSLRYCRSQRLLNKHVFAIFKTLTREFIMGGNGRDNGYSINSCRRDDIMGIACDLKAWVQRRHPLQRFWVLVAYSGDFAVGKPVKVPDYIGSPITIANDAHSEHVVHVLSLVEIQARGGPVRVHEQRVWDKAPHPYYKTLSQRESGHDGAASTGAVTFDDGPGGLEQQFEIGPERPLGYVLQVEAYHVVKGGAAAPLHLPEPRETRLYFPHAAEMPDIVACDFIRNGRPRTH